MSAHDQWNAHLNLRKKETLEKEIEEVGRRSAGIDTKGHKPRAYDPMLSILGKNTKVEWIIHNTMILQIKLESHLCEE